MWLLPIISDSREELWGVAYPSIEESGNRTFETVLEGYGIIRDQERSPLSTAPLEESVILSHVPMSLEQGVRVEYDRKS